MAARIVYPLTEDELDRHDESWRKFGAYQAKHAAITVLLQDARRLLKERDEAQRLLREMALKARPLMTSADYAEGREYCRWCYAIAWQDPNIHVVHAPFCIYRRITEHLAAVDVDIE